MKDYNPASDLLQDRVILVTGAGDGIGRAVSLACAAHGATVVLLGKTISKLEAVYDAIEDAGGPTPAIYPMHLAGATPVDYDMLAQKLDENFGHLDGLLHNAADLPYLSRISDYDVETWMQVMQVNLNAPFLMTQACLPLLQKSADASIVFSSDAVAHHGKAYWGAYAASKAGAENLMQTLADELENSPVRVNSFDPGPTLTSLRRRIFPGENPETLKQPEAVVNDYLWLLGPDSQGSNGRSLRYETK